MFERMNNYINDNEFRFTVYENKIHIINYKRILSLEDNYISFQSQKEKITIQGNQLSLNKLLENEMLITGFITKIEVMHE